MVPAEDRRQWENSWRSRLARVGLIGCSIYVYRSYDFDGTLGQNVATAVLVSAMALNVLFIQQDIKVQTWEKIFCKCTFKK